MSADRKFFEVKAHLPAEKPGQHEFFRIVSLSGGDTVAYGIPSKDLAEAMCEGANNARSKKK
jgi:hypothetical protein